MRVTRTFKIPFVDSIVDWYEEVFCKKIIVNYYQRQDFEKGKVTKVRKTNLLGAILILLKMYLRRKVGIYETADIQVLGKYSFYKENNDD